MGSTGSPYNLPWPELPDVADGPDAFADLAKAVAAGLSSDKAQLTTLINTNKTTAANDNNALRSSLQANIDGVSLLARQEWYHTAASGLNFSSGGGTLGYIGNTVIGAKSYLRFAGIFFRGYATALGSGESVQMELRENVSDGILAYQHIRAVNLSYGGWAFRSVPANTAPQFQVVANATGSASLTSNGAYSGMDVFLLARE
jgi:hypothetical protein